LPHPPFGFTNRYRVVPCVADDSVALCLEGALTGQWQKVAVALIWQFWFRG
jgi:hypothetical protein